MSCHNQSGDGASRDKLPPALKVMWITPIILPAASKRLGMDSSGSGGWLGAMAPLLQNATPPIDLHVAILYPGSKPSSFEENGINYHLIPDRKSIFHDRKSILAAFRSLISSVKPDVIDIQGVEFHHAKYAAMAAEGIPVAATLQGLTSEVHKHYFGNMSIGELLRFRTLKDNLFLDGLLERKNKYRSRGVSELEALSRVNYFIGRTHWDRSVSRAANPSAKYFFSRRNIRADFHQKKWDLQRIKPFSIFVSQAHAPFKGLHILLESISILRRTLPDVSVYIAGRDMLARQTLVQRLKYGGYQKYLQHLIGKYKLEGAIHFTGLLNSEAMADKMSRCHAFVLPSFIENSPNSLGEAQLMGVPSVAAFVGGVPDMVQHGVTGFMYNPVDSAVLADFLRQLFTDDTLSRRISEASMAHARQRYNSNVGGQELAAIYQEIHLSAR